MSYKALLNAKAVSSMYNNNYINHNNNDATDHQHQNMTAEVPTYSQDHSIHSGDEEEEEDYVNGQGSPTSEHAASNEPANIPEQFSNFSLKRCRFAPRQDIELLKEVYSTDDKPYTHVGKASWESWGKIAHTLNEKQIFGPILTLSALTCKLRFEFLLKNFGGHALKYNPKRGTPDEFRNRDELIGLVAPMVPDRGDGGEGGLSNGKRRRGRPRKREHFSSAEEEEDGHHDSEMDYGHSRSMLASGAGPSVNNNSNKRKPGRPRKINSGTPGSFMDGAALADFLQTPRPRTRQQTVGNDTGSSGAAAAGGELNLDKSMSSSQKLLLRMGLAPHASQPYLHYMAQPAVGLPEGSVVTMLAEYLKRHHEQDLAFKREEMEIRQRDKSEERRLEREQLEVKKAEIELRKSEIALQNEKWELERQEREVNLELMKKKILKL